MSFGNVVEQISISLTTLSSLMVLNQASSPFCIFCGHRLFKLVTLWLH